jgi:hypothetical protein
MTTTKNNGDELYTYLKDTGKAVHDILDEIRQRPTRTEVENMLATKINADVYNAEMKGIRDDISDLREKPARMQGWLGLVIAGGGCLLTIVAIVLSTIVSVITLTLQHWGPK